MFEPDFVPFRSTLAHMTHEPPLEPTAQLEIKVVFHIEGVVLAGDTSERRGVIEHVG